MHLILNSLVGILSSNQKTTKNSMSRSRLVVAISKAISSRIQSPLEILPLLMTMIESPLLTIRSAWWLRRLASTIPLMQSSEWHTLHLLNQAWNHSLIPLWTRKFSMLTCLHSICRWTLIMKTLKLLSEIGMCQRLTRLTIMVPDRWTGIPFNTSFSGLSLLTTSWLMEYQLVFVMRLTHNVCSPPILVPPLSRSHPGQLRSSNKITPK